MMTSPKMNLNFLTELVSLEQPYEVSDGEGGRLIEWRVVETLWASITAQRPGTSTEKWQGERAHFSPRYWVWLRGEHVLPTRYQLKWKKGVLTPISAVVHMMGSEWQMILAEERGAMKDER